MNNFSHLNGISSVLTWLYIRRFVREVKTDAATPSILCGNVSAQDHCKQCHC